MKYKAILRPAFKKFLFAPLHTISVGRNLLFMCQKVLVAILKMPLQIVQAQMKIFVKSSLVKANTVCHLSLAVLTLLNCN